MNRFEREALELAERKCVGSYGIEQNAIVLTEAMNSHDIARGRGGVAAALARVTARSLVLGIDSDRYFPLSGQEEIAAGLAASIHGRSPVVVASEYGHDAFLIEDDAIAAAIRELLAA